LNLFVFGFGYSARYFVGRLSGWEVAGTTRAAHKEAREDVELLHFDGNSAEASISARLMAGEALLVSIPPSGGGDLVLQWFAPAIAKGRWRAIVYLSTVGVYGDHRGAWIDEGSATEPSLARNRARLEAERAWLKLGREIGAPVHILRLAGIYGPGRNALVNLREGRARRIVKPGQVFNRIHVADIAQAIGLTLEAGGPGDIWNVADDEPAPPPEAPFESADLTPMARSFYGDNKRVSNAKLTRELGLRLLYPSYREGLGALAAAGEGR
jgi:hypothetical protein